MLLSSCKFVHVFVCVCVCRSFLITLCAFFQEVTMTHLCFQPCWKPTNVSNCLTVDADQLKGLFFYVRGIKMWWNVYQHVNHFLFLQILLPSFITHMILIRASSPMTSLSHKRLHLHQPGRLPPIPCGQDRYLKSECVKWRFERGFGSAWSVMNLNKARSTGWAAFFIQDYIGYRIWFYW